MKYIAIFLMCFLLSSCATTLAHIENNEKNCPHSYYAGTQGDLKALGEIFSSESASNGLELILLVDLPLSLVADTLIFPYYLVSKNEPENTVYKDCANSL